MSLSLSVFLALVAVMGVPLLTMRRFGWVNASYVVGLEVLDDELRKGLEGMIPYDEYKKASA